MQPLSLTSNAQYEPTPINQSIPHSTAEQSLPITTSVYTGQTQIGKSLQQNLPVQANANNHEAQRQYTTVSMDQNTISQGAQQIPTCMHNTNLTSTSQVYPPAGNVFQSSQFSTKSKVGGRSYNGKKIQAL